jgi:hypothetical protein
MMAGRTAPSRGTIQVRHHEVDYLVEDGRRCSDLTTLREDLASLGDISLDTTIDNLRDTGQQIVDDANAALESAGDVAEARDDALQGARADFDLAMGGMSADDSIAEFLESLRESLTAPDAAQAKLFSNLGCQGAVGVKPGSRRCR